MTDIEQGNQGAQATNLGGQLRGGQPDQGPSQNPWQPGGGGGRNPWTMMIDLIRPPGNQPDYLTGERQNLTSTRPQDYIPGDRREADQWGKPDHILTGARNYPGVTPGPFMPQGQAQMAQVFHQSAAGLANMGSPMIGQMGGMAAAYQTNYIKGLMQGQEWKARMNRLKMQETAERLQEEQDKESLAYAEIMAGYQDSPQLEDKIRDHAIHKVGGVDQPILDALNAGGVPAAKRVLQERDWHNQNLAKTNQQRKDEEAQKDTEKYLDPNEGQQPGTQPSASKPTLSLQPPTPTPTAPSPVQPAQTAGPLPPLPRVSDDMKRDAQAIQMGEKPMVVPNTQAAQTGLAHFKNALDDRIRNIIDPKYNVPPDQVMPLLRDANPGMADLVQNILDGNAPTAAEAGKEPYRTALNIAHRINPTSGVALDPMSESVAEQIARYDIPAPALGTRNLQNRALMAEVKRLNPNYRAYGYKVKQDFSGGGKHADTMRSMDVAIDHMDALDEYSKALKTRNSQVINRARAIFQQMTGLPAPQNVQEASAIVGAEVQKALGATTKGEREQAAGYFGVANSPEQAIAATNVARRLLSGQLNGLRQEYKNGTGLDDFDTLLNPRTVSVLDATRGGTSAGTSAPDVDQSAIDAEMKRRGLK